MVVLRSMVSWLSFAGHALWDRIAYNWAEGQAIVLAMWHLTIIADGHIRYFASKRSFCARRSLITLWLTISKAM